MNQLITRDAPATEITSRIATFVPSTMQGNTVEAILSTSADVQRSGYIERLGDWGTLPERIPLLDSHRRDSIDHVIGYVDGLRNEGGTVRGVCHISDSRPDIRAKVADGSISATSIGFSAQWRDATEQGRRFRIADQITLHEASLVVVPADNGARLRALAATVGVPDGFLQQLTTRGLTEEQMNSEVIREAARTQPRVDGRAHVTRDSTESLISRMADGLYTRVDASHQPSVGREFACSSISEMARRWLTENGASAFGSAPVIIERAFQVRSLGGLMTTSDFPGLFSEVFNKSLLDLRTQPSPVSVIFRKSTAADYRPKHTFEITDGPALLRVTESGEIKSGTVSSKELSSYKVEPWARILGLTEQVIINDDANAFGDVAGMLTRGARTWYESMLVSVIISNPLLADGLPVFHASRGNLAATGSVPDDASLAEARTAMRMQKDASGVPLNATPQYLLIPAQYEQIVDQLLALLYPATPAEASVAARNLTVLVDPRIDTSAEPNSWFVFANPQFAPVFEVSELAGLQGPRVDSRFGFNTLGAEWRLVWRLGASAIDSRGGYKNPGAAVTGLTTREESFRRAQATRDEESTRAEAKASREMKETKK